MPMELVRTKAAISRREFHRRLRAWLATTQDPDATVGDFEHSGVQGRAPWIHIRDAGHLYKVHADTKRKGVAEYVALLDSDEISPEWVPKAGSKRILPAGRHIKCLQFYLIR